MITSQEYRGEEDYNRLRDLLVECYAINKTMHCWGIARLDWWRFDSHADEERSGVRNWEKDVRLWGMETGQLVGAAHLGKEGGCNVFLQIHPHYRHLEREMFAWAEEHHAANKPSSATSWPLNTYVVDYDQQRARLLGRRGYKKLEVVAYERWCSLDRRIPSTRLPEGYEVRTVGDTDMELWAAVVRATYGNPLITAERCRTWLKAPTQRRDLNLVVVAPDRTFAAFATAWLDEANHIGLFEPVGTHPAHRRRGLGTAVMCEGLRRLQALGATRAYVGVGTDEAANRLYESVGFIDFDVRYHWRRAFCE